MTCCSVYAVFWAGAWPFPPIMEEPCRVTVLVVEIPYFPGSFVRRPVL